MMVRTADCADLPCALDLCWRAHAEMPDRSLCRVKVSGFVARAIMDGLVGMVDDYSLIGLIRSAPWFSDEPELYDWLTYVRPEHRSVGAFNALVVWAKAEAARRRIPLILGFVGDQRTDAKARLYGKHLTPYGGVFRFVPPHMTEKAA